MNCQNELYDNNSSDDDTESHASSHVTDSEDDDNGSVSSIESFSGDLSQLRSIVATINETIEALETRLISIQRPIEALHVNQLGDVPFLESSPFRHTMLKFKSPHVRIPGLAPGKRHTFSEIMAHVRTYLFDSDAIDADGNIHITPDMQRVLGITDTTTATTTYVDIMRHMRDIVQ